MREVVGVILAAGQGRRMGSPKALLKLKDRTFLEVIYDGMKGAGVERVAVVLGAEAGRVRAECTVSGIEWILNEDYSKGQLSSLWCGLRWAGDAWGAMVTLVDHPAVKPETYETLINMFKETPHNIIIPIVNSRRGHPIVIAQEFFPLFLDAPLEQGARWVTRGGLAPVREVPVDDPGIRVDIDRPIDYARMAGKRKDQ